MASGTLAPPRIRQVLKMMAPKVDADGNELGGVPVVLPPATVYRYLVTKMLRVESQRSSSLIEINIYSQDPALGAEIANERDDIAAYIAAHGLYRTTHE